MTLVVMRSKMLRLLNSILKPFTKQSRQARYKYKIMGTLPQSVWYFLKIALILKECIQDLMTKGPVIMMEIIICQVNHLLFLLYFYLESVQ